jgi:L-aspartate oxidase
MDDMLVEDGACVGVHAHDRDGNRIELRSREHGVLATGGVGGLYEHSTNYRLLTGTAAASAEEHGVALSTWTTCRSPHDRSNTTKPGRASSSR